MTNALRRSTPLATLALALLLAGCPSPTPTDTPPEAPPTQTASGATGATPDATTASPSPGAEASASPAATAAGEQVGPPVPPSPASTTGPTPFKSLGKPRKTASGIVIDDMKVGTGPAPKKGQFVKVHYIGTLTDGKQFDASYERNQPFEFQIGLGQVIEGWDQGVMEMKVGGRSKLTIPWALAYGADGRPPVIPPSADLVFDVELLGVSDTRTVAPGM